MIHYCLSLGLSLPLLVEPKTSQQLLDGYPCHFVQRFVVPRGWSLPAFGDLPDFFLRHRHEVDIYSFDLIWTTIRSEAFKVGGWPPQRRANVFREAQWVEVKKCCIRYQKENCINVCVVRDQRYSSLGEFFPSQKPIYALKLRLKVYFGLIVECLWGWISIMIP